MGGAESKLKLQQSVQLLLQRAWAPHELDIETFVRTAPSASDVFTLLNPAALHAIHQAYPSNLAVLIVKVCARALVSSHRSVARRWQKGSARRPYSFVPQWRCLAVT